VDRWGTRNRSTYPAGNKIAQEYQEYRTIPAETPYIPITGLLRVGKMAKRTARGRDSANKRADWNRAMQSDKQKKVHLQVYKEDTK